MPKRIVVTGAAGFIGRNVVAELNARGVDDLILVDHLGHDEKWRNLLGLRFEDFLNPAEYLQRHAQIEADAIIHLGACSATTERDADFLLANNYRYTRMLATHAVDRGVRFIYASSAATYGDGRHGYSDDDTVTPTLRPLNMYGYSKQMFDLWALKSGLLDRIVGLKYFNVFGPYEDHKGDMRSVVHKSFDQIMKTGEISLFKSYRDDFADGEQLRDFIYVNDVVAVTLFFLEQPRVGGLFNCGTGRARSWKDLALAVFKSMNREPRIQFIEMPEVLKGKYQYFTQADVRKLRAAGYAKPFMELEDGVQDYVSQLSVQNVD